MLPAVGDPAVLDLEDDAAVDVQLLPSRSAVLRWMPITRPSSPASTRCNSALNVPPVSPAYRPNWAKIASRPAWSPARRPRPGVCQEALSSKSSVRASHVGRVEGLVAAPHDRGAVAVVSHRATDMAHSSQVGPPAATGTC